MRNKCTDTFFLCYSYAHGAHIILTSYCTYYCQQPWEPSRQEVVEQTNRDKMMSTRIILIIYDTCNPHIPNHLHDVATPARHSSIFSPKRIHNVLFQVSFFSSCTMLVPLCLPQCLSLPTTSSLVLYTPPTPTQSGDLASDLAAQYQIPF